MTTVLVLGGDGMLGHKLVQVLGEQHEVWTTIRGERVPSVLPTDRTLVGVDAITPARITEALISSEAKVVVNAIGVVKQSGAASDRAALIRANSLLPHELAARCQPRGVRLIQVSTDCVFSGARGNYSEADRADPTDAYGQSKLLGEVEGPGCLTLRTSIIGRELRRTSGLLEWFLGRRDAGHAKGYSKAVFSGFTTAALAGLIGTIIEEQPQLGGLWHASAEPIDKFTLLAAVRDAMGLQIELEPDEQLVIDRSLDSSALREELAWQPPTWDAMLAELAADQTPYEELRHAAT